MFPRHGFVLNESRSCPLIGPGFGAKSMSPRFGTPQKPQGPPHVAYDLPPVESYRAVGASPTARMGPGFGRPASERDVELAPPGEGAPVIYDSWEHDDRKIGRVNTAPKMGPGFGRPSFPRQAPLAPPGCGTSTLYDLPTPDTYRKREPRVPRWDPAYARFPKPRRLLTDAQYSLPDAKVYLAGAKVGFTRLGPGLGRAVGPRVDERQYRVGHGADKLYDIPSIYVTKSSTDGSAHTFAPPVVRHEVGSRQADVPIRIPSAVPPPWLSRLSAHKPRPRDPWLAKGPAVRATSPSPSPS